MDAKFEKLLEPLRIGKVQTKNRMIKTSAETNSSEGGFITDKHKFFYEALARGGVGMIVVEAAHVDFPIKEPGRPKGIHLNDDKFIPGLTELTRIIHKYGCPAFIQLAHAGIWRPPIPGVQPVGASTMTREEMPPPEAGGTPYELPRALTLPEIEEVINQFAKMAERAQKAGFDGVEVNGAGGHLINSFISRFWNHRQDQYGPQNMENRARLMVNIIKAIKQRTGKDFAVSTIINGAEYAVGDKGTTIEEAVELSKLLQAAGADAIQVRAFGYSDNTVKEWLENVYYPEPPTPLVPGLDWSHHGAGAYLPLAIAVKKEVSIPIITVGRLDPILGEQILREGKADLIGMNRRLMADPELPNKAIAGKLNYVAPCTGCMHCASGVITAQGLVCRINAALGGKNDYQIKPSPKKKKVVIVGGGPAGMEAARVAALRGHQVTLFEKGSKLGGLLPLAALVKGTEVEDLPAIVNYFKTQITSLGVDIKLGKEFTTSLVDEIKPDVVILAAGGISAVPDIPGIESRKVVSGPNLHHQLKMYLKYFSPETLRWLTRFYLPLGKRVVIIGGAIQGAELAEFLVKRGRQVTIVDTGGPMAIGEGLSIIKKVYLIPWLIKKGVTLITEVRKYEKITDKGLVIVNKEGKNQIVEADSIATAVAMKPNTEMVKALKGKVKEVYTIGDCKEGRLILDAVAEGYQTAKTI